VRASQFPELQIVELRKGKISPKPLKKLGNLLDGSLSAYAKRMPENTMAQL
jgi:hypothetical protein